jgi:hypothetical protein
MSCIIGSDKSLIRRPYLKSMHIRYNFIAHLFKNKDENAYKNYKKIIIYINLKIFYTGILSRNRKKFVDQINYLRL